MTYRKLLEIIAKFNEEQLDQDVTIYEPYEMEFYPATDVLFADENNDVLDEDHPFIQF